MRCARLGLVYAAVLLLAGCSGSGSFWGGKARGSGPRVVKPGQSVPKGGGHHKLGSPYTINGQTYVPRKDPNYNRTGIASWYGEDYHGRRTANGEIYDMEALTAAHPTLPLPCYVRVTNHRNGRSLVVRVNDRGPFVNGRIIDLSWGVASLLQLDGAGTGPVRVQYVGPAPLNGDDNYERRILAAQRWAGPRVAFAASPAKALISRKATATYDAGNRGAPQRTRAPAPAALGGQRAHITAGYTVLMTPETAGNRALTRKFISDRLPHTIPAARAPARLRRAPALHARLPKPQARPAARRKPKTETRRADTRRTRIAAARHPPLPAKRVARFRTAAAVAQHKPAVQQTAKQQAPARPLYVEAGVFAQRATADKLATILKEIAPARVELTTSGTAIVHRLRLGPFAAPETAQHVINRIRAAGLTQARILPAHEI
jgi:rare lipoprotein A